jgi:hypothetical protein
MKNKLITDEEILIHLDDIRRVIEDDKALGAMKYQIASVHISVLGDYIDKIAKALHGIADKV